MVGAFFLTQKWILKSASRRAFLIVQLRISHYYCLKEKKRKKKKWKHCCCLNIVSTKQICLGFSFRKNRQCIEWISDTEALNSKCTVETSWFTTLFIKFGSAAIMQNFKMVWVWKNVIYLWLLVCFIIIT